MANVVPMGGEDLSAILDSSIPNIQFMMQEVNDLSVSDGILGTVKLQFNLAASEVINILDQLKENYKFVFRFCEIAKEECEKQVGKCSRP